MSRSEFIIATAIVLFVAFLVGWFAHWLVHRFTRVNQADFGELDKMAKELHEAEELRDGDMYEDEDEPRLSTLPAHTPPPRSSYSNGHGSGRGPAQEGSLLGDEFTSPHSSVKKGD